MANQTQTSSINITMNRVISLPLLVTKKTRNAEQKSSLYGCNNVGGNFPCGAF